MVKSIRSKSAPKRKKKNRLNEFALAELIGEYASGGTEWTLDPDYAGHLLDTHALPSDFRRILQKDSGRFASKKRNKKSESSKAHRPKRVDVYKITLREKKALSSLISQITEGLNASPPYIPLPAFFSAASMSRTDEETENLMRAMHEKYGAKAVPAIEQSRTMSSGEQYNARLIHDAYAPFHDADTHIMRHPAYQVILKQFIPGSLFGELGPATGAKTNELFELVGPPAAYEGIEFLHECIGPLRENLERHFKNAANLVTTEADFCDQSLWQNDICKRWGQAREEFGRPIVIAMLGLTNGNLKNNPFGALLGNMRFCMGTKDIIIISNDATGTPDDGDFDLQAEINKLDAAYNPPGIKPYLHYIVHHALRLADCESLNHRLATAHAGFNLDTLTVERSLSFNPPQLLRSSGSDRAKNMIGKINFPGSRKRSLNEMARLADRNSLKILGSLPDPTGATRISWVFMARKNSPLPALIL